jgi:glutathione S-transferase
MSEFEDLNPARTYASTTHVEALNQGRPAFATGTSLQGQATKEQVTTWLEETAGILDGLLRQKGYVTPAPTTAATSALKTLENFNAIGAWYHVEHSAKQANRLKEAEEMWKWARKMLSDGLIDLDLPFDLDETQPRGGFSSAATPLFTREMRL